MLGQLKIMFVCCKVLNAHEMTLAKKSSAKPISPNTITPHENLRRLQN